MSETEIEITITSKKIQVAVNGEPKGQILRTKDGDFRYTPTGKLKDAWEPHPSLEACAVSIEKAYS